MNQSVVVLDFGGANSQLIARKIRGHQVYCELLPFNTAADKIKAKNPIGIVLTDAALGEYKPDPAVFDLGLPVLVVSHGDDRFESNAKKNVTSLEFASVDFTAGLKSFLFEGCKAKPDWTMGSFAEKTVADLKRKLAGKKGLCALSGGVDSAVAAALVAKACPDLICIFVDHGLLRKGEVDEVVSTFRDKQGINLIHVNASTRFLAKLQGVTEPEAKRKIIGEEFIRVFEEQARNIGAVDFLVQGTIYPDIIESGIGGAVVKSHHNVGGLPSVIDFKELVEPLSELFKDEVRACGLEIGLPDYVVMRQPFPGPGLGVRVIGELTEERLDTLRDADYILREEIKIAGLDKSIWQYFAVLLSARSVGVVSDARAYGYTIALRAVHSVDGMTADWAKIPFDVLEKISSRITSEVKNINRVVYDITSKPPATIEWE